jgi:hypothetical protein
MNAPTKYCRLLSFVIILAGPMAGQAQELSSTVHQLLVGVSQYARISREGQLRFAHKDALDLGGFLKSSSGQRTTLVNSQATLGNILAGLDELMQRARPGDWAVVLLSGHGDLSRSRDGGWFFLPHDFDPADPEGTALSKKLLDSYLYRLAESRVNVLLILDACHAGAMTLGEPRYAVLAGCRPDQLCREPPELANGAFTRAILEGLQGEADANRDGIVTLEELQAYVQGRLRQYQRAGILRRHGQQDPVFAWPVSVEANLPFARTPNTGPSRPTGASKPMSARPPKGDAARKDMLAAAPVQ